MAWKPVASDEGCGRSGIRWVLVDEICGDGDGTDMRSLETPMFRDGAIFGSQMLAVDGTHLWSLDLRDPTRIKRSSLLTGIGQPSRATKEFTYHRRICESVRALKAPGCCVG
jgi:hypothetical protein